MKNKHLSSIAIRSSKVRASQSSSLNTIAMFWGTLVRSYYYTLSANADLSHKYDAYMTPVETPLRPRAVGEGGVGRWGGRLNCYDKTANTQQQSSQKVVMLKCEPVFC